MMVHPEEFNVLFKKQYGVFFAGETLVGHVHFKIQEPFEVQGISLKISGKVKTGWSEIRGSGSKSRTVFYTDKDQVIDKDITLKLYSTKEEQLLQPGSYDIPFEYQLDDNLPSSVEGNNGHIRYFCCAKLSGPKEYKSVTGFTVIQEMNLTQSLTHKHPMHGRCRSEVTCCGVHRGEMVATTCTDKSGYVPGEYVMINVEVHNDSDAKMTESKAMLKQITHAKGKMDTLTGQDGFGSSERSKVVAEVKGGGVERWLAGCWKNVPMLVPPLPPSTPRNLTHMISISYMFVFKGKVKGGDDIKIEEPISIGTSPVLHEVLNGSPVVTQQPSTLQSADTTDGPPSYQECMTGSVEVKDEEAYTYTPAYPFYPMQPPMFMRKEDNRV